MNGLIGLMKSLMKCYDNDEIDDVIVIVESVSHNDYIGDVACINAICGMVHVMMVWKCNDDECAAGDHNKLIVNAFHQFLIQCHFNVFRLSGYFIIVIQGLIFWNRKFIQHVFSSVY